MKNDSNGRAALDGLLDALAQRVGDRATPHNDDALAELHATLHRLKAAVDRLVEVVENKPKPHGVEPLLCDRQTAARALGISPSLLDNMRRDGTLPAVVLGKTKPMWLASDLRSFAEQNRERPGSQGIDAGGVHEKCPAASTAGPSEWS